MEALKRNKKIILVIVIIICISAFTFNHLRYKVLTKHHEGDRYFTNNVGTNLIQVQKYGKIREYIVDEKKYREYEVEGILDIKYTNPMYSEAPEKQLIIKEDGIYIDMELKFEGVKIGDIPNAVHGDINDYDIFIVTKEGQLYEYRYNMSEDAANADFNYSNTFILNEDIKDVIKVISQHNYIFALTAKGEVYGRGVMYKDTESIFHQFKKFDTPNPIIDIHCGEGYEIGTIVALDDKGYVYDLGHSLFGVGVQAELHFEKIDFLEDIKHISVAGKKAIAIDDQGTLYCWGNRFKGKSSSFRYYKKIRRLKDVEDAYCNYNRIYAIKNNKIYVIPIPR